MSATRTLYWEVREPGFDFEYAVKFIHGRIPQASGELPPTDAALPSGVYFTAINVHNPGIEPARLRKKLAIALANEKPGEIVVLPRCELGPDEAMEIDGQEVLLYTRLSGFTKGFVIIQSSVLLDVVAVYAAAGEDGWVATMGIERVPPRKLG